MDAVIRRPSQPERVHCPDCQQTVSYYVLGGTTYLSAHHGTPVSGRIPTETCRGSDREAPVTTRA